MQNTCNSICLIHITAWYIFYPSLCKSLSMIDLRSKCLCINVMYLPIRSVWTHIYIKCLWGDA
jgi:hypothetical protein